MKRQPRCRRKNTIENIIYDPDKESNIKHIADIINIRCLKSPPPSTEYVYVVCVYDGAFALHTFDMFVRRDPQYSTFVACQQSGWILLPLISLGVQEDGAYGSISLPPYPITCQTNFTEALQMLRREK